MRTIPMRLEPGTDLHKALQATVQSEGLTAAWVMTCVGSLSKVTLRLDGIHTDEDAFEIISAAGTLGPDRIHVHLSVADPKGTMIGGHLVTGCVVATEGTVELVLGADDTWRFGRERHPGTGFDELSIEPSRRTTTP